MENVVGVFTAFLVAIGPLAILVERAVTAFRLMVGTDRYMKANWIWIVLPFIVGIGLCLGWEFNLAATLAKSIPAMANTTRFDGTAGEILTGLAVGAVAGPWHEKIQELNTRSKAHVAMTESPVIHSDTV